MSIFSNILEKLGMKRKEEPKPPVTPPSAGTRPLTPSPVQNPPSSPPTSPVSQVPPVSPPPAPAKPEVAPTTPAGMPPQPQFNRPPQWEEMTRPVQQPAPATPAAPTPIPMVDVVGKLNEMAAKNPQKLDWKVSIVDLLKLLGIDSSYDARKELAVELGCPANLMNDSAQMNTWLHKTVLQKLAENGGNIPKELLD